FAAIENLGIISIDEEHDGSYFSETNPRYYTHTIAEQRAKFNNCKLVLGSATPSIDTYHKTQQGEYGLLELNCRVNNAQMPTIEVVDMCKEIKEGNGSMFSRSFLTQLNQCIENKQQAIIFLNRRGFSRSVMCKACGYVAKCKDCDVALVYHKEDATLKCHYCSNRYKELNECPECKSKYLKYGAIGTEKVCEELANIYGNKIPILRMDNDTTQNKDSLIKILDKFANTKPAILVGTQMLAKGHHFPSVTLVGIIDADVSLHFSDYRASERTFQLITQVAGRAGRESEKGKVVLQTYAPNHYVYRFASNYEYKGFYNKEINTRSVTKYPPYTKIVRILLSGEKDNILHEEIKKAYQEIKSLSLPFVYLGAASCPLKRMQNKFRYQILMRFNCENSKNILECLYKVYDKINRKDVNKFFEINPQNLS
ncbi:MAG: primosomal protein N', partial [Firmicutes bacterium]|nr:primosomal protein N' [Bacillota bacterium]